MPNPEFAKKLSIVNCYECGASLKMTCLCGGCARKQIAKDKLANKNKR